MYKDENTIQYSCRFQVNRELHRLIMISVSFIYSTDNPFPWGAIMDIVKIIERQIAPINLSIFI